MDVQNFRMLQNFKYKEQKLEETLYKQKLNLQHLRKEYQSLKKNEEVKTTSTEKLKQKKNLRSIYTFKLPVSKQKNKNDIEAPERIRNGWIQRPLSELPRKVQELNRQRSRMIELGNSYSENNKNCPLATKTIRSVKTQHEMKYEMLNRAKLLGNHYSFRFRQHHPIKVYKKSIESYKKHEHLINQKIEMEEFFKSGQEVPQIFPQKYLHVIDEIYRLEKELNPNHEFSDGKICQKILHSDSSIDQRLINQLSYPIFGGSDVISDKIEMERAMDRIDIRTILEATNIVEQRISEVFWSKEDVEEVTEKDLGLKVWKNEATDSNVEEMSLKSGEVDFNDIGIDSNNQEPMEIISENIEVDSNLEKVNKIKENQINKNFLEFDDNDQDVVIENEELVYINEKFQSKNNEFNLNSEYLDRASHNFFTFKNLILELSEQALQIANESSTSLNNLKDHTSDNLPSIDSSPDTTITFSPIFSQKLDSKLSETLKVICKNYIEDLCDISNIPKHHPSFEDVRINFIHETQSNVDAGQENDDSQEISQVSHEICKSQSSILRTQRVESSKLSEMTNDAILDENFITYSIQEDLTNGDCKSYNYSREMALSSIGNSQSAIYNVA